MYILLNEEHNHLILDIICIFRFFYDVYATRREFVIIIRVLVVTFYYVLVMFLIINGIYYIK